MAVAAIIPAAGRGLRLGGDEPKALREVGGEPLLVHAVRGLVAGAAGLSHLVIAVPPGSEAELTRLLAPYAAPAELVCVPGGTERTDSVRAALAAVPESGIECILVHDAARPFVPADVVARVVDAVRAGAAAVVPVVPVTDTIKRVDASGRVLDTPDRSALVACQTPQGFAPDVLRRAHRGSGHAATDDAALVERLGIAVQTVDGSQDALKITRPRDLLLAEAIVNERAVR